ncbi:MAG: hypothetical protein WC372_00195 [Candidatus Neomarinimicrobiota bacterium]|jgi:hypothetical protein|nr:hypothetical protein [Candidatus Neomarinimicrobiota bacterium]MDX9779409.1 hypothetical protein [bacterium]
MKKILFTSMLVVLLMLSGCNFGGFWDDDNDENVTLATLVESELLAEYDSDTAIEEAIEISVPATFSKFAPGPNPQQNRKRINLLLKHEVDSVDVSHSISYTTDDTALVTVNKTLYGTLYIHHNDTTVTDTPVVWEKDYVYSTTAYWQYAHFNNADSSSDSAANTATDTSGWRLTAKSLEAGATEGIMNEIEQVLVVSDEDSEEILFDDPEKLYTVSRGYTWQGAFRGRPGTLSTNVFVTISGNDDVNVLGSSGRHFALADDGLGLDFTADDRIFSGSVLKGRGQSRLRVQMLTTATFIEEDAPVEMASWFLPLR